MPDLTIAPYAEGILGILDDSIDLNTGTIKVALLTDTYTPDMNADKFMSDVAADEINEDGSVGGTYEAGHGGSGRQTLSSKTFTRSGAVVKVDAADVTFPSMHADLDEVKYAVIFEEKASDATSRLIALGTAATNLDPDGNNMTITWHADGILQRPTP